MKSTRRMKRFGVVMAVTLVAIGALAGAAFAAPGDAIIDGAENPAVTGFTPGSFSGTLNGAAQQLSDTADPFSDEFLVTDATGSGSGWEVTVAATQFDNGLTDTAHHTIPLTALKMPVYVVAGNEGSTAAPTIGISIPTVVDAGGLSLAECAAGEGMGIYTFTTVGSWTLDLPTDQYAGDYHSTVTTTVAALVD
jgi:hypothetical protein